MPEGRLFALAAAALAALSMAFTPAASATPGRDVDGKVLWQTSDDGKDYVFREITIAPGGSTGWHSHDGELLGVVKAGVLSHYRADCSMDGTYVAGQNPPGRRSPMTRPIRAAGLLDARTGHLSVYRLRIIPRGIDERRFCAG